MQVSLRVHADVDERPRRRAGSTIHGRRTRMRRLDAAGGKRRRRVALGAGCMAAALLASSCSIALGDLGGPTSVANAINEAGVIVGRSEVPGGATHAFRRLPDGTMVDLGTLPGGIGSAAFAVNESGQVAGTATMPTGDPAHPATHAVRWDADGTIHDLGVISGTSGFPSVVGIDEQGRIVGQHVTPAGTRAFVFDPAVGHLVDLAGLPGGTNSLVYGMNDAGDAVGYQDVPPTGYVTAVRWDLDAGTVTDVTATWGHGLLTDINDAGVIIGMRQDGPGAPIRAAVLHPGDPTSQLLDLVDTPIPTSINDHDVVVGYHGTGGPVVGFRWEASTGVVDLPGNDPEAGTIARAINDRGQIVGSDGPAAALLIVPAPAP